MAVDLIGVDQVGEHETVLERRDQLAGARERGRVRGAGMLDVDPHAGEQLADLADAVHGHATVVQAHPGRTATVARARGRVGRRFARSARPFRGTDGAITRPIARSPVHLGAHLCADLVELRRRHDVLVGGDLQHGVLARVEDQRPAAQVLGAEVLDRVDAVVGPVADHMRPLALVARCDTISAGKPSGKVGSGCRAQATPIRPQWPAIESLPGPRAQPAVQHRLATARDALQRQDAAEAEALQRRQRQSARGLREVAERVRALVAVAAASGSAPTPSASSTTTNARFSGGGPDHDTQRFWHFSQLRHRSRPARAESARGAREIGFVRWSAERWV